MGIESCTAAVTSRPFPRLSYSKNIKMVGTNPLAQEAFWANKAECDDAEKKYYQNLYGKVDALGAMAGNEELLKKVASLEIENKSLKKVTDDLKNLVTKLETRVSQLEKGSGGGAPAPAAPAKVEEE